MEYYIIINMHMAYTEIESDLLNNKGIGTIGIKERRKISVAVGLVLIFC